MQGTYNPTYNLLTKSPGPLSLCPSATAFLRDGQWLRADGRYSTLSIQYGHHKVRTIGAF